MNARTPLKYPSLQPNHSTNILSLDPDITPEQTEEFLKALDPKRQAASSAIRVIRNQEAMQLLACTRPTLLRLVRDGHLTQVFGCGNKCGIGITSESYHRFINNCSVRNATIKPTPSYSREHKRMAAREQTIRKIRWSYHFNSSTTRTEKYQAISRLLASNKNISKSTACLAAGIHVASYSSYLLSLTRPQSKQSQRLAQAADIIERTIPRTQQPPSLRKLRAILAQHGVNTTTGSIARILDELGYNRAKNI